MQLLELATVCILRHVDHLLLSGSVFVGLERKNIRRGKFTKRLRYQFIEDL